MPQLTEEERFLADLQDDLFICYVVVADEGSEAWKTARRASKFAPQVNIYRFDDHAVLKPIIGSGKPVAVSFSRLGTPVSKLNAALAEDLDSVLGAMEDALKAPA